MIQMKMTMKNSLHRYDINWPRPRHGHKYKKIKRISLWWCLYILTHEVPVLPSIDWFLYEDNPGT